MRIMGRPRALVAVVAGALLLAGCGSGPSQVGAAAVVGDRSVSIDQVQELIDKAVREQPYAQKLAKEHKLEVVGRAAVGQLVMHELLAEAAAKRGITPNYAQIDAQLAKDPLNGPVPVPADASTEAQAVNQVVARARDHREELTDTYLAQALADKTIPNLRITFDYTSVGLIPDPRTGVTPQGPEATKAAYDLARQFADDPGAADQRIRSDVQALTAMRKQATTAGQDPDSVPGFAGGGNVLPAAQAGTLASTPLFGSPVGSTVVMPFPGGQGAWLIAVIRQRDDDKAVATEKAPELDAATKTAIGMRQLQLLFGELGVRVNKRYGVWDVVSMTVAPTLDSAQGAVLSPGGSGRTQQ